MHSISISQPGYIDRLLAKFNMTNAKSASMPFEPGTKLRMATLNDKLCNIELYQELTGSLNHLAVFSRPDITFAVSKLSKYNADPTTVHFKAALHVLQYLKSTRNYCLVYYRSTTVPIIDILGFSDSDFTSDEDDRKSYTGYVFLICGGAVSWSTHKQSTVALSSMEAEYMALSDAAREALHENNSSVSSKSHPANNLSQFYQTVNQHSISPRIQLNIDRQSTSTSDIMQSVTTFTITRLMSITFPQNINQPIFSLKRSHLQSINSSVIWSVYTTATMYLNLEEVF